MGYQTRLLGGEMPNAREKKPRRDPKTSRCNIIYAGPIEREPQPRLCRQARTRTQIDTPQSFSSVTSLPNQANNVGCRSPKEIPPLFARVRVRVKLAPPRLQPPGVLSCSMTSCLTSFERSPKESAISEVIV